LEGTLVTAAAAAAGRGPTTIRVSMVEAEEVEER
jgi:hypothetical protein